MNLMLFADWAVGRDRKQCDKENFRNTFLVLDFSSLTITHSPNPLYFHFRSDPQSWGKSSLEIGKTERGLNWARSESLKTDKASRRGRETTLWRSNYEFKSSFRLSQLLSFHPRVEERHYNDVPTLSLSLSWFT